MSLIFITGISTSGKSTIANVLAKRGYEVYDTEHNGMSAWYDRETGERAAEFDEIPERTKKWLDQHWWLISTERIAELAQKSAKKNQLIFLCGGGANESEVRGMCSLVIWLKTDESTIRQRVNNPRDHDYGTRPHELARILDANKRKEAEYAAYDAIMVDATQPIERVVDEIVAAIVSK